MAPNDAINVLLSLAASNTAKDGPDMVRYFRNLALWPMRELEVFGQRFETGFRLGELLLNLMMSVQKRLVAGDLGAFELGGDLIIRKDHGTAILEIRHKPRGSKRPGKLHEFVLNVHADDLFTAGLNRFKGLHGAKMTSETTIDLEALIELTAFVTDRERSGDG